jgi:dTDP-L-rhamnose 4-epimerase
MRILVTGGAGFIGSFLVDALVKRGETVRIFDNLEDQVHQGKPPAYLNPHAEFVQGDVRDVDTFWQALQGIDTVFHCAAAVGVGQSQYEIKRYSDVNVQGTAHLLHFLANEKHQVQRLLLPTSMTSYGEGCYRCATHGTVRPGLRGKEQLERHDWSLHCPQCAAVVEPIPTPESAERQSGTIYALSKNMQEDMALNIARTYGISATALRLFNVFGPRQSLSNPYTGVTAIFLSRLKNGQRPTVYEDGLQSRDFISVHDVVRAFLLAMDIDAARGEVFNIGSGKPTSIVEIARTLASLTSSPLGPEVTGQYRVNDVRHCYANRSKAKQLLGWEPQVSFEEGMRELVAWGKEQESRDTFAEAETQLMKRNLQA